MENSRVKKSPFISLLFSFPPSGGRSIRIEKERWDEQKQSRINGWSSSECFCFPFFFPSSSPLFPVEQQKIGPSQSLHRKKKKGGGERREGSGRGKGSDGFSFPHPAFFSFSQIATAAKAGGFPGLGFGKFGSERREV